MATSYYYELILFDSHAVFTCSQPQRPIPGTPVLAKAAESARSPMGGPCYLVEEPRAADAAAHANSPAGGGRGALAPAIAPRKRMIGPPCTDNFQVAPFPFDGDEWQSVEQCYQACKVLKTTTFGASFRQRMQQMRPFAGETDHNHGMRVWREGASAGLRSDWDAVKVEVMLRVCRAKLLANEAVRRELLSTGDAQIRGAPSTSWTGSSGDGHSWTSWNGRIQTLLREELRQQAAGEPSSELYGTLRRQFDEYMATEGGSEHPLPGG